MIEIYIPVGSNTKHSITPPWRPLWRRTRPTARPSSPSAWSSCQGPSGSLAPERGRKIRGKFKVFHLASVLTHSLLHPRHALHLSGRLYILEDFTFLVRNHSARIYTN